MSKLRHQDVSGWKGLVEAKDWRLILEKEITMAQVRIMHYLNQFFAGVGGEDKADVPVDFRDGSMGPGKRLQALLGDSTKIVVTAYCGDNYFAENYDKAVADIVQIAKDFNAQMVIAGPAFASGRYGFACVEVCHSLSTSLDLYGVAGLNIENPGIEIYQQYKDKRVFVLPAAKEIRGMEDALLMMAKFVSKLASGSATGSASEEGYIPRGIRVPATASKPGKTRAVEMLLNKLAGRPFETEIPIASLEQIPVTLGITNLQDASLVLISEGGVIPLGNPDEFKVLRNTRWGKYSIEGLDSMQDATWDVIHGGYDTEFMRNNPNYGVPLDVCRQLEREGRFAKLHPYFYGTSGSNASILAMQTIGRELVADIKTEHIDAALLVST